MISERSLDSSKEYQLVIPEPEVHNRPGVNNRPATNIQVLQREGQQISIIDITTLADVCFETEDLILKVNEWAADLKFKMAVSEGMKRQNQRCKRTYECSNSNCPFKLMFVSDLDESYYTIDLKLSSKYNTHSTNFHLFMSNLLIDHELNYEVRSFFKPDIEKELDYLKGRVGLISDIQMMINEKFGTHFDYLQIRYKIDTLLKKSYGKAELDAYKFVQLGEEKKRDEGAYFEYILGNENELKNVIYISKTMLVYSQYFLDFVLVDSTYKRNRFNLPLVNVVGVNNLGKTVVLAFGMLTDETNESYSWFFEKLLEGWNKRCPKVFICDETQAIYNGMNFYNIYKILFFSKCYFNVYNYKKVVFIS